MTKKACSRCKIKKDEIDFSKNKSRFDGLSVWCTTCKGVVSKEYYCNNKHSKQEYYKRNKIRILQNNLEKYNSEKKRKYNSKLLCLK